MKNKTSKTKIILTVAGVLNIAFAVVYVFALREIDDMSLEVATCEQEAIKMNEEDSNTHQLATLLEEIGPAQEKISEYFVNRDNYIDFLEYLENLAETAGIVAVLKSNPTTGSLNFSITYEGAFDNIMYFTALIESLPYNLMIDSVHVEKVSVTGELWRGGIKISLPGSGGN